MALLKLEKSNEIQQSSPTEYNTNIQQSTTTQSKGIQRNPIQFDI